MFAFLQWTSEQNKIQSTVTSTPDNFEEHCTYNIKHLNKAGMLNHRANYISHTTIPGIILVCTSHKSEDFHFITVLIYHVKQNPTTKHAMSGASN